MSLSRKITGRIVAGTLIAVSTVGCSNMNNTQKGAVVGTAGGAAVGAIVGKQLGSTGAGAAVGALTGLAAGGLIGNAEDKAEERDNATRQANYEHNMRVRQQRAITNRDVVDMAGSGVSDSIIIKEMRVRGGNFDTTPQAIIFLQRQGVSDTVIQAMQDQSGN